MSNIITHTDFVQYRTIVKKYDIDKVEASITQAHSDLSEVLGGAFYLTVLKNQATPEYADLMDGSEYTKGELTYMHEGIKSLVADYAYARYIYDINANHTPFGLVGKNSNDSEPVDRSVLKDMVKQAQQDAAKKWESIEDYLNENSNKYPVWAKQQSSGIDNTGNSFNSTRFTFLSTGK